MIASGRCITCSGSSMAAPAGSWQPPLLIIAVAEWWTSALCSMRLTDDVFDLSFEFNVVWLFPEHSSYKAHLTKLYRKRVHASHWSVGTSRPCIKNWNCSLLLLLVGIDTRSTFIGFSLKTSSEHRLASAHDFIQNDLWLVSIFQMPPMVCTLANVY